MTGIDNQQDILQKLYEIVSVSRPEGIGEASCKFDLELFEDGSSSVGQFFEYLDQDGVWVSSALDRELRLPVSKLVKDLHSDMLNHTGGDWDWFTLKIDSAEKVSVQFNYRNN